MRLNNTPRSCSQGLQGVRSVALWSCSFSNLKHAVRTSLQPLCEAPPGAGKEEGGGQEGTERLSEESAMVFCKGVAACFGHRASVQMQQYQERCVVCLHAMGWCEAWHARSEI